MEFCHLQMINGFGWAALGSEAGVRWVRDCCSCARGVFSQQLGIPTSVKSSVDQVDHVDQVGLFIFVSKSHFNLPFPLEVSQSQAHPDL